MLEAAGQEATDQQQNPIVDGQQRIGEEAGEQAEAHNGAEPTHVELGAGDRTRKKLHDSIQ